ncbi:MAG: MoxR family ATPase [Lachnospiraceae bacterium]|nr:MoxR family ATPase [Lachnospiraceae bacterium]
MQRICDEIKKNIKGKDAIINRVLCTMLAGGHILLEDIPGVGKTTLATSISEAMSLDYKRVQFTPDVMPSDITGFNMYNAQTQKFEYHEGSAICNLLLADEINRTSPKTQSALLELMEEGKVTVDGVTHYIPKPFFVIATQNPFGSAGTQRLPESQMDRFMVRLSMGYPDHSASVEILRTEALNEKVDAVMTKEQLLELQESVKSVFVDEAILEMVVNISEASRTSENIQLGLSPRGAKALLRMAKAQAFLNKRDFVTAQDVIANLSCVASHRIVLSAKARAKNIDVDFVLNKILDEINMPKI